MKTSKKILALIMAVACLTLLAVPAMAAEDEAKVITGVQLSEAAENLVDSAQYSQYETVEFSDGSSETINVDEQTFVLVKDGVVVDLADPANWSEGAELYKIDKGQSDEVMMSMNSANFGTFYFTGVVDFEDGKYNEEKSIPAAVKDAEITDEGITGGQIDINADYVSAIYVYNEDGSKVTIKDVTINSRGMGGNDFGTNGGWGTVISVSGSAEAEIDSVVIDTAGPLHDGIWAGGNSVVDVKNTIVVATEDAAGFDFEPYTYDRFVITEAPLTDEEIAEKGLSGEFYSEDYESMFGSGTKYYYTNENWTSNWSAPMLQCVPLALGLHGSMRAAICYGQATLSFYDSLVISDIWAVLSTDSGSGTLNAYDTVAAIGVPAEVDSEEMTWKQTVNGVEYGLHMYDTTEGSGYVTYCDGFDDNFYGCSFFAPDYLAILTGGTFDFTQSEINRGYGICDRIAFMSHGNAYTANISHSDFEVKDAFWAVMSTGAVSITLEDVGVHIYGEDPWSGALFQFMDTDDTGTDANDLEMDILDLTYEEYLANEAASDGTTKTVVIKDTYLEGDIYNSTGSSNNTHTSDAYDGTTNYLSTWSRSKVDLTLDDATIIGAITTSYAQHCDEEGNAIEGLFFFNKTGEPMEGTEDNTYDFHAGRRVINTPAYNGIGLIDVTLTNGATWEVSSESIINYLSIAEGCEVKGTLTENEDGTLTLLPSDEVIPAGEYGTKIELAAQAAGGSEGGEGQGESAGEAAEGESEGGEGESAEEAASEGGEGESAEEAGGDAIGKQTEELEITYNGVTAMALYEDTVDGTSEKRGFQITFDGKVYTGGIDKGVWVADNEEDQGLIDAYQAAHESDPSFQGAPPS